MAGVSDTNKFRVIRAASEGGTVSLGVLTQIPEGGAIGGACKFKLVKINEDGTYTATGDEIDGFCIA